VSAVRVAAHVHSTWSYDGEWELRDLPRAFARRGYDAVLMSEHDRTFDDERWEAFGAACAAASAGGGALLIPGIEYSDAQNLVHVPVWGAPGFLGKDRPTGDLLRAARAAGAVAVLAHPLRRDAWRTFEPSWLELAHGVEIWNRKVDGWAPSAAGLQLAGQHDLRPFVGLDFHSARQFFPLAMTAPLDSALSAEAVLDVVRAGALRAIAFGRPAASFSQGRGLEAVRAGERVRRPLARAYRRARSVATRD
jgi:predicted metal-dependent phosphoesterase TrpH